jgi:hypothetical protein
MKLSKNISVTIATLSATALVLDVWMGMTEGIDSDFLWAFMCSSLLLAGAVIQLFKLKRKDNAKYYVRR